MEGSITLDNVISILDECFGDERYNIVPLECEPDYGKEALYYLKEYRSEKAMWEADRKRYLNWIEQYKEAREKHQQAVIELKKNPPLTWEQLKQMVGKPVWVETKYYSSRWAVITDVDDVRISFVGKKLLDSEIVQEMGKTWQAYRKERE